MRYRHLSNHIETLEIRALLSAVYVDLNAPGPVHDGSSWDHAYTTIQLGMAAAVSGDEVRVADGEYVSTFGSHIQLKSGVRLLGGYAGSGAANPDARDVAGHPTTISGSSETSGAEGLVTTDQADPTTTLDGFTLVCGGFNDVSVVNNAGAPTFHHITFHGGMGMLNQNAQPLITDCLFDGCGGDDGGGMTNLDSSPTITNCQFLHCHGLTGGAMRNNGTSPSTPIMISGCTFTENAASHEGQAIYNYNAAVTFTDCTFNNNAEDFETGGAIYTNGGEPAPLILNHCTFTGNHGSQGGAILSGLAPLTIDYCTFTRNHAFSSGGAILGSGPMTITNTIFQGNNSYNTGTIDASSTTLRITNCVFSGNEAGSSRQGGALALRSCNAIVTNCTFGGNRSGYTGGAIWLRNSTLELRNSIVWNDSAAVDGDEIYLFPSGRSSVVYDHSAVGYTHGSSSPFVRVPSPGADGYFGTVDDDYGNLRPTLNASNADQQSLVDGGDNFLVPGSVTTDIAGNPRFVDVLHHGAIVDMGAYEYTLPLQAVSGSYLYNATNRRSRSRLMGTLTIAPLIHPISSCLTQSPTNRLPALHRSRRVMMARGLHCGSFPTRCRMETIAQRYFLALLPIAPAIR